MSQIVTTNSIPRRANLAACTTGSLKNEVLNNNEYLAICSSNSLDINGQGKLDCYIVGDGVKSVSTLVSEGVHTLDSNTNFLVCSTQGSTAEKTINFPTFELSTKIRLLIQMQHANTAANPTLNINGTGAKSIIYNGNAASDSNSWSNNEVVDVYYDGDNHFITTTYGGAQFSTGEKVGNVGIDDEPTAGSDNLVKSGGVQNELALGAVYDVSAKNPTAGPNNDGKWESLSALFSDANISTLIPVAVRKGGMSIKFVQSSDNKYVQYSLTKDEWSLSQADWQKMNLEEEVSQLGQDTEYLNNISKQHFSAINVNDYQLAVGYIKNFSTTPEWSITTSTRHIVIPISDLGGISSIKVIGNPSQIVYMAFLSSYNVVAGGDPGILSNSTINANGSKVVSIPNGANYLYFYAKNGSTSYLPSLVILDDGIARIETSLSDLINSGYVYAGVAQSDTNPGTPSAKVFYLADTPGTYTYFGGIVLADGEVAILKWNSSWSKEDVLVASSATVNKLQQDCFPFKNLIGGYVNSSSQISYNTSGNYKFAKIPVLPNKEYILYLNGTTHTSPWLIFMDVNGDVIGERLKYHIGETIITSPANASYVAINCVFAGVGNPNNFSLYSQPLFSAEVSDVVCEKINGNINISTNKVAFNTNHTIIRKRVIPGKKYVLFVPEESSPSKYYLFTSDADGQQNGSLGSYVTGYNALTAPEGANYLWVMIIFSNVGSLLYSLFESDDRIPQMQSDIQELQLEIGGELQFLKNKKVRIFGGSVAWGLDNKFTVGRTLFANVGATLLDSAQSGAGFTTNMEISGGVVSFSGVNIQKQVDDATVNGQDVYDFYILWASTNDLTKAGGTEVGNSADYTASDNFDITKRLNQSGAINYCIKKLAEFAPQAKIVVVGSLKMFHVNSGSTSGGGYYAPGCAMDGGLKHLVDGQQLCAERFSLPFYSLWENSGCNEYNSDVFMKQPKTIDGVTYDINDGTHPNQTGYEIICAKLLNFLKSV